MLMNRAQACSGWRNGHLQTISGEEHGALMLHRWTNWVARGQASDEVREWLTRCACTPLSKDNSNATSEAMPDVRPIVATEPLIRVVSACLYAIMQRKLGNLLAS